MKRTATKSVHQLLPSFVTGDAIGNYVRTLRTLLRSQGYESEIFAEHTDPKSRLDARPWKQLRRAADDGTLTLLHHSIECGFVPMLRKLPGRKAVVYHNVTPSHFFASSAPVVADACDAGRAELRELASFAVHAFFVSRFNGEELWSAGFPRVDRFPFLVDWTAFDAPPDERLARQLKDGRTNILFVGRMDAPNKRADDLIRVFAAYQRLFDKESRLVLAGGFNPSLAYGQNLKGLASALGAQRVHFLGRVNQAELSACFTTASAYVSMSDHEGLGVPLLEAMHRDVPVLAYGASAVAETMDGAGLCVNHKDPVEVAKVLAVLVNDKGLRARVLSGQRARLARFADPLELSVVSQAVAELLDGGVAQHAPRRSWPAKLIVCPELDARPDGVFAKAALDAARVSPDAALYTLAVKERSSGAGPRRTKRDGVECFLFSPEWPAAAGEVPRGSSALETAAVSSAAKILYFGEPDSFSHRLATQLGSRFTLAAVASAPASENKDNKDNKRVARAS